MRHQIVGVAGVGRPDYFYLGSAMMSKNYNRAMRGAGQKYPERIIPGFMKARTLNDRTSAGNAKKKATDK
jgi:hypothetical protein